MYYQLRKKLFEETLSALAAFLLVCGLAFFVFVESPTGYLVGAGCWTVLGLGCLITNKPKKSKGRYWP